MCEAKQCSAPTEDGSRCLKTAIDATKLHCRDHYDKALALYIDYKAVCQTADEHDLHQYRKFPDLPGQIKYLTKCYCCYINAYNARMKHRDYGFVPECHDYGHNLQFTIIQKKIDQCEEILCDLYDKMVKEKEQKEIKHQEEIKALKIMNAVTETKDLKLERQNENIKSSINRIRNFKKKRAHDLRETDRLLEKYAAEGEKIRLAKMARIDQIMEHLDEVLDLPDDEFSYLIGLYHLIRNTYGLGYYEDDFEPEKCNRCFGACDCGNYMSYTMKLACECVFQYEYFEHYLFSCSPESLDIFENLIKEYPDRLAQLVHNYSEHWDNLKEKVLRTEFEVAWSPEQNRLVMTVAPEPDRPVRARRTQKGRKKRTKTYLF